MHIQTYTVSKNSLANIPTEERDFFLLAGHFANEIVFWSKLATITETTVTNNKSQDKIVTKANVTQAMIVNKTLAGKLYEGWQMIRKAYFGTAISKDYHQLLGNDAQEAIKELSRYFKRKNFIEKVRNSYAFHYGADEIGAALDEMAAGDEFDMYIAEQHINSLYYVSESAINKSMLRELSPDDLQSGSDKLYEEIVLVHKLLFTFINSFMKALVTRHFVKTAENPVGQKVETGELLNLKDLELPYFVKPAP